MKKKLWIAFAFALCSVLLLSACAAKSESVAYDTAAYESDMSYGNSFAAGEAPKAQEMSTTSDSAQQSTQADSTVRKIVYTADMRVTADAPETALAELTAKTEALGGYVAASYTTTDEDGAYRCTATLKVPADSLEELINAAEATGKVDDYRLSSDDISGNYYDIKARLGNAQAEEKQLVELLERCDTIEDVLAVRQSLTSVRADIESYSATMQLYDNLVDYATLELTINRTPKQAVEQQKELITIWKASDVGKRMWDGLQNSARFMVNAVAAVGIFIAIAIIPAGILFLCIGLPIIISKKKKKQRKTAAALAEAEKQEDVEETPRLNE